MLKLKKPLPTRKKVIRVISPEDKANRARLENNRNRTMASYYFDETPSITNLAKGAYYWIKGNLFGDSENPEDYKYIEGEVPIVGTTKKKAYELGKKALDKIAKEAPSQQFLEGAQAYLNKYKNLFSKEVLQDLENYAQLMSEKITRAYKLGVLRGTQTAERTAQLQIKSARKQGADILRRWLLRGTQQTATSNTPTRLQITETISPGFWGNTKRILWETKNNNFTDNYKLRNALRVPFYLSTTPIAMGTMFRAIPEYAEYVGKSFRTGYDLGRSNDTILLPKKDTVVINNNADTVVANQNSTDTIPILIVDLIEGNPYIIQ